MNPLQPRETRSSGSIGSIVIGLGALAVMVWLREDQGFWRQPDPATAWMRPLVQFAYYPTVLLVAGTISHQILRTERVRRARRWIVLWMASVALSGIVLYGFANNIENFLGGLPVHYHSPPSTHGYEAATP